MFVCIIANVQPCFISSRPPPPPPRARSQLYILWGTSVVIEGEYYFLLMSGANYYVRLNFHLRGHGPAPPPPPKYGS